MFSIRKWLQDRGETQHVCYYERGESYLHLKEFPRAPEPPGKTFSALWLPSGTVGVSYKREPWFHEKFVDGTAS